ncbi:MAG: hypothetical protein K2W82_16315 [Candidatus Obscuribacterales bacterium]|nr:hypothetical protein [Candidatus Obscuribacterales bacterium]
MTDTMKAYLMLGLLLAQFVCFFLSVGFLLQAYAGRLKDREARVDPVSLYRSNILGGWGFLLMGGLSFWVQQYVWGDQAWLSWLGGVTFCLVGGFCLWLGSTRRRHYITKQIAEALVREVHKNRLPK